jgi:hypothetical protein
VFYPLQLSLILKRTPVNFYFILVPVKFKILKRAYEQESLMQCHHFIDVAVADWGDVYTCQKLAHVAIPTHFPFNKNLKIPFLLFLN